MKYAVLALLLVPHLIWAQQRTLSGYVYDANNGEALIGATIIDAHSGSGTITNTYGFFSLTTASDSLDLTVSFVGFEQLRQPITLTEDKVMDFQLKSGSVLEEIVVYAEEDLVTTSQMSTIDVPVAQIKNLPVLLGEGDVLKTLQLLPGIQGGTEGSSGIYVRGGGPDQNLMLLDGVPVYNASHLFGFFSVFNPDAINNVSVMKGGFPARYGGRLSSVVDVQLKEGNNQKLSGAGSIGLIAAKFTLEGPIKSEKTSFLVSARRTYLDVIARPATKIISNGEATGGYFFHDYIAKINHRFSQKDRLYLSAYAGLDKASAKDKYSYGTQESKDEFGLRWGNFISALRWNHLFTPKLFGNLTGTYSQYRFKIFEDYETIDNGTNPPDIYEYHFEYFSGIRDFAVKFDLDYEPNPANSIKTGVQATLHTFTPGVLAYKEDAADTSYGASARDAVEAFTYIEDDITIGKRLKFNVGAHYSIFQIEDRFYQSFQPRISGRLLLFNDYAVKASYVEMAQYIHLLTNGGIGLPTDLWVPATDEIKPQSSKQVAAGIAKNFGKFEVSVEGYYKTMNNLIEYKEGASYINTGNDWEDKVVSGNGESKGLEVFIQKKTGKLNGWVGYTLSKTDRQFPELNNGEPFPYKFDRRHDLSIVSMYDINDHIKVSGTWVYGTGNAITMPYSTYPSYLGEIRNLNLWEDAVNYGDRNSYRMRAYHRLDLSISFLKQKPKFERTWTFGIYNVYNRKNPFFLDIRNTGSTKRFVQYSLFPIIPSFQYSIKF